MIWDVQNPAARGLLYVGFAFGWLLVLVATFLINHFDLFGLRQVWNHLRGEQPGGLKFSTPFLYRIVRHPLYVGWLFTFWCAPTMTATTGSFALVTTTYILVAIRFEERDLMQVHPEYAEYRKQVPMVSTGLAQPAGPCPGLERSQQLSQCLARGGLSQAARIASELSKRRRRSGSVIESARLRITRRHWPRYRSALPASWQTEAASAAACRMRHSISGQRCRPSTRSAVSDRRGRPQSAPRPPRRHPGSYVPT